MQIFLKHFIITTCLLFISACGGETAATATSSSASETADATTEAEAESVAQQTLTLTNSATNLSTSASDSESQNLMFTITSYSIPCTSGTQTITVDDVEETLSIVAEDCETAYGTTDGSFNASYSSSGTTVTTTMVYDDYLLETSTSTQTMDGTVSVESDTSTSMGTITFSDFATTSTGSNDFMITGTITIDSATSVLNGTMLLTSSSNSVTCEFDDFDMTTATQADFQSACS